MQQQDAPAELMPNEHPGALFPQRLGLSGVIEGQVREYGRLARSGRRVDEEQVEALLELISKRRDAAAIFTAAGHELADLHFEGLRGAVRRLSRRLPGPLRRRAAVRSLRAANDAFLVASDVAVKRKPLEIRATNTLTARVSGAGSACQIYAALASSLIDLGGAGPAAIVHSECQGRGDRCCVWQTAGADGPDD
jgi:hypothetical protein